MSSTLSQRRCCAARTKATIGWSDTIRRLMAAQVEVRIVRDGKRYLRRIQLLGAVDRPEDEDEDGNVYYRFPAELREIIQQSEHLRPPADRGDVLLHARSMRWPFTR